jgi:hypothetical protein
MAWFRCSCGYMVELQPIAGEIVSVYHFHAAARVDKSAQLTRMEPLPDPVPERAVAVAAALSPR